MTTSSEVYAPSAAGAAGRRDPSLPFLIGGIVLLLVSIGLLFTGSAADPVRPFLGYLVGLTFWTSILVGMLFLVMIWWMFDSGWSVIIRRQMEFFLVGFVVIAVAFLPLVFLAISGSDVVAWTWIDETREKPGTFGTVAEDTLFLAKAAYLNVPFFTARFILIFAAWIGLAFLLRQWSFRMDETGDHKYVLWSRRLSAVGLFIAALVTTMAAMDWFMSLNYHWFSTMYGIWFFSASMRAALAATVIILFWQAGRKEGLRGLIQPTHFYFMGCLMLAFTVFWAYISFSQYFLIYSANIPEVTFWYNIREKTVEGALNAWWWVSMALIFLHFLVPFLFLLFHKNKFGKPLLLIAVWILFFHIIDIYWNILPQKLSAEGLLGYTERGFVPHLTDLTAFLAVGALVIWAFLRSASKHRPIPIRDPRIRESLNLHE
jgi:hypothetical protein